ncbi:type II CRISPR-associated endonuclease Cas1 [Treponema sp. OMZ 840]|uniref:type II CRISPR-associated endonuclease Cas1 n=1 Tax=Treponema sp. OMZ 840 TaxID=244313 RepID=UPI003D8ED4FC
MLHQIVEIQEENRHLSLERGFLNIRTKDEEIGKVALDDIAVLLISAQGASITKNIIVELSSRGAVTVLCGKNYEPVSIVYPVAGNYRHAGIIRTQIDASIPFQKQIWKQIVSRKLHNQAKSLLLCGNKPEAALLEHISKDVKSGDKDQREGYGAKVYWQALFGKDFIRDQDGDGINALLNYGYAVMRSSMCRALCAAGLHPALGIHHQNMLNPFCLADDFFEIYRPIVDCIVYKLCENMLFVLTPETKKTLIQALWIKMKTVEGYSPAFQSMHYMASSFVKALKLRDADFEIPVWEGKNEKFSRIE